MKDNKKTYWKGIEELSNDPEFVKYADKEFPDHLPLDGEDNGEGSSRRDFLKMMGFGIAAASMAACEAPVNKAIPYLNKPEVIEPGVPNYYASTYINGGDCCSIVVKTREGRPILVEGNKLSDIYQGGVNAQVEASVLSLYDKHRLTAPQASGKKSTWEQIDAAIVKGLAAGGQIAVVSNTVVSPTTKEVINSFISKYPSARHISYDANSSYGMLKANQASFGQAIVPSYDFSKADVIVSFGADFLGTWLSPVEFTKQYSKTRKVGRNKKTMSRHYQFEANLSMTGANADYRGQIKPSQEGQYLGDLYDLVSGRGSDNKDATLQKAASELRAARGRSVVVSGSNDPDIQLVVNAINNALGNYGNTIDPATPLYTRQGNDEAMTRFVNDLNAGNISTVIFYNANPVYEHPLGSQIAKGLSRAKLTVATNDRLDETSSLVQYIAPDHHYLESWNDAEPKKGYLSLAQPTITPLFDTRQAQSSFLTWAGNQETDYYTYLQNSWRTKYFPLQSQKADFKQFWLKSLFDGVFQPAAAGQETAAVAYSGNPGSARQRISNRYKTSESGLELALYEKVSIGTGSQANNPWLQELPDPVTKACWENYITIPQSLATEMGLEMNEGRTRLVNLTVNGQTYKLPALVQPGQTRGTIGLAIGYGRTVAGKVAEGKGFNAYPLVQNTDGINLYSVGGNITLEDAGEAYSIARTQTHHTYMGRESVVQEAVLSEYKKDPGAGRHHPMVATSEGFKRPEDVTLWKGHKYPNHHWGMIVDLNSCTGCGTCSVACTAENNVPVVGKEEVLNRREMQWIRIDRYYSSDAAPDDLKGMEVAAENPEVVFQPMMCQHCNNAPCETVCPVVATTHSTEGLNQMTYNRCIGTRYCANNCPYKVRRFNWFKYHDNEQFAENTSMSNDLGKMVLNPDVVVRSRGVMEKCTFCVQRIQLGKLQAKQENRRTRDGDITTACASVCPADALVFGDMNDPESRISKLLNEEVGERAYHALEYLNVKPNVSYLTKIKNRDKEKESVQENA